MKISEKQLHKLIAIVQMLLTTLTETKTEASYQIYTDVQLFLNEIIGQQSTELREVE